MDGFFLKMSVNEMLNLARGLLRKSMTFLFHTDWLIYAMWKRR